MRVTINGISIQLDPPATLAEVVAKHRAGSKEGPCAVEVNEGLVAHDRRATVEVKDGDRIEIVSLVGGG